MPDIDYEAVQLKLSEKEVALKTADGDCLTALGGYRNVLKVRENIAVSSSCQNLPQADDPDDMNDNSTVKGAHPDMLRLESDLQAASQRKKAAIRTNIRLWTCYPNIRW
jgi:hypothetical protein